MELEVFLMLFLCSCLNGDLGSSQIRKKRGIFELVGTIGCETKRSSLSYLGYGCYCGLGGHGIPKDKTDWCCYEHDCCYGRAEHIGCYPKSRNYKWKCVNDTVKCGYTREWCQNIACKCDQEFAKCLRKASYNSKYAFYPNFLCGNENLPCKYLKD